MLDAAKVDLAMEQAMGNMTLASKLLNVERHQVYNTIKANATLAARWGNGEGGKPSLKTPVAAPGEETSFHREAVPEVSDDVLQQELATARAVQREEEVLLREKDLSRMGFTDEMVKLAAACRSFTTKHYLKLTEMQSGGINRQFFRVMIALDKIDERLEFLDGEDPSEPVARGALLAEKGMLLDHRSELLNWLVRARDSTSKAFLVDAQVFKIRNGKGKQKERPKSFLRIQGADAE